LGTVVRYHFLPKNVKFKDIFLACNILVTIG
jgi:hypothetical protein